MNYVYVALFIVNREPSLVTILKWWKLIKMPLNVTEIVKLQTGACWWMPNEKGGTIFWIETKFVVKFNLGFMFYITDTCYLL